MNAEERVVALVTKHNKESVIGPLFKNILNWNLEVLNIDTDEFGTFSGEKPRLLSPEQTVLAKAREGLKFTKQKSILASEGTITSHPLSPLLTIDYEIIAYLDVDLGIEIIEKYTSFEIKVLKELINRESNIDKLLEKIELDNHAVIIKNEGDKIQWVRKGIRKKNDLKSEILEFFKYFPNQNLILESDFRAMHSPSRMKNIEICATNLAHRLNIKCPSCETIGWGVSSHEFGIPCSYCGDIVKNIVNADIWACVKCEYREVNAREQVTADPGQCPSCNP